ncbi:hypothetical protein [Pseudooceanicola sp. MF1-13]|uniref:hypothetical protein n=1 Tax=Pseudooceanicola sp. MF1-13 TaxID=3379095 RepID=UPI0038919EA7
MHDQIDDQGLDLFFDAARRTPAQPSEDVLARIAGDAARVQAGFGATVLRPRRAGRVSQFLAAIGGWPAMAGLATAGVAGLWIGAVPPAFVETLTSGVITTADTADDDLYLVDPLPGYAVTYALEDSQ